jgi:hypothetical protein
LSRAHTRGSLVDDLQLGRAVGDSAPASVLSGEDLATVVLDDDRRPWQRGQLAQRVAQTTAGQREAPKNSRTL